MPMQKLWCYKYSNIEFMMLSKRLFMCFQNTTHL